jgi:hypothetical protein
MRVLRECELVAQRCGCVVGAWVSSAGAREGLHNPDLESQLCGGDAGVESLVETSLFLPQLRGDSVLFQNFGIFGIRASPGQQKTLLLSGDGPEMRVFRDWLLK